MDEGRNASVWNVSKFAGSNPAPPTTMTSEEVRKQRTVGTAVKRRVKVGESVDGTMTC